MAKRPNRVVGHNDQSNQQRVAQKISSPLSASHSQTNKMKRRRDGQGLPEVVCLEGHIDSDLKIIFIVRQRFLEVLVLSDRLPTVFIPLHTQVQIYRRPQLIKQSHSQVDIESQPSIWKGSAWNWILHRIWYLPRHKEQNVDLLHSGKNLEASAATTNATGKQRFSGEILWIFLPSRSVSQPQLEFDSASKYLIQANILAALCVLPFVDQLTESLDAPSKSLHTESTKSNDHQEVHRDDSVTFTDSKFCGHLSQRRAILANYSPAAALEQPTGHCLDWLGVVGQSMRSPEQTELRIQPRPGTDRQRLEIAHKTTWRFMPETVSVVE